MAELRVVGTESKWDTEAHEKKEYEGCKMIEIAEMDLIAFVKLTPVEGKTTVHRTMYQETYDRPVSGS